MLNLGILAFAQPWILLGLIALPALWLLLRLTPPAPKRVRFPAMRLLLGLKPAEETPARTPWWLLALRLLLAALLIIAAAEPLLNPSAKLGGRGPLLLVIDDGWAAAPRWNDRVEAWSQLLERAERQSRPVILATTAPDLAGTTGRVEPANSASAVREVLSALEPKPWPVDRRALANAIASLQLPGGAEAVWLSDGLASDGDTDLARRLQRLGGLTLLTDPPGARAKTLLPPAPGAQKLQTVLRRPVTGLPEPVVVEAYAENGRLLGQAESQFGAQEGETVARFDLPLELRNEVVRLALTSGGGGSAGAVALLDERWRRRPVGLFSPDRLEADKPLLGELFFLEKALAPFSELRRGSIEELLSRALSVLVLADSGGLRPEEQALVAGWVEAGGLLLRFAGPRLVDAVATSGGDPERLLLPVRLRPGDRLLSGSLAWGQSGALAAFPQGSPFEGLGSSDDVTIGRQVLAEPSLDLVNKTWARLEDGTPLVTAAPRGEGQVVLIHTSANSSWSNLPLSGLFVAMLHRIVEISEGIDSSGDETRLPPIQLLDGFGRLTDPWPKAPDLEARTALASAAAPPGLYGVQGERHALNLGPTLQTLAPLAGLPAGVAEESYKIGRERSLLPWLLTAALILASLDLLIALALRGLLRRPAGLGATGLGATGLGAATTSLFLLALLPLSAMAQQGEFSPTPQDPEVLALEASTETRLAFVRTGVPALDRKSEAGLNGLTIILRQRTSIDAASPFGIDPSRDELAFFPLLYWPVTRDQRPLDSRGRQAIADYMRNGGTIVFDLQEERAGRGFPGLLSPGEAALRSVTAGLELPPLALLDPDHVLTKAFYLLQEFPGRFQDAGLWVESVGEEQNDGVASVIITNSDWAGAWAVDDRGRPLYPVVPGGERQREISYRVGVNLAMYALTGNYKADQVHVPFILERLGQ